MFLYVVALIVCIFLGCLNGKRNEFANEEARTTQSLKNYQATCKDLRNILINKGRNYSANLTQCQSVALKCNETVKLLNEVDKIHTPQELLEHQHSIAKSINIINSKQVQCIVQHQLMVFHSTLLSIGLARLQLPPTTRSLLPQKFSRHHLQSAIEFFESTLAIFLSVKEDPKLALVDNMHAMISFIHRQFQSLLSHLLSYHRLISKKKRNFLVALSPIALWHSWNKYRNFHVILEEKVDQLFLSCFYLCHYMGTIYLQEGIYYQIEKYDALPVDVMLEFLHLVIHKDKKQKTKKSQSSSDSLAAATHTASTDKNDIQPHEIFYAIQMPKLAIYQARIEIAIPSPYHGFYVTTTDGADYAISDNVEGGDDKQEMDKLLQKLVASTSTIFTVNGLYCSPPPRHTTTSSITAAGLKDVFLSYPFEKTMMTDDVIDDDDDDDDDDDEEKEEEKEEELTQKKISHDELVKKKDHLDLCYFYLNRSTRFTSATASATAPMTSRAPSSPSSLFWPTIVTLYLISPIVIAPSVKYQTAYPTAVFSPSVRGEKIEDGGQNRMKGYHSSSRDITLPMQRLE